MSPARPAPTLDTETELARDGARFVAGMDEVGRGALAGPASVGLVVLDVPVLLGPSPDDAARTGTAHTSGSPRPAVPPGLRAASPAPGRADRTPARPWEGVRDSKALSAARREALAPGIGEWAVATAVGHAQPAEIDELGITAALRLAGLRALDAVRRAGARVDALILDGSHNWLDAAPVLGQEEAPVELPPVVRTLVKADVACVSVAAASILAKVERDALMTRLAAAHPQYDWASNKGYGSASHRAALLEHGVTAQHRRSWNLGVRPS
ncbi:ribonuclease HII [Kocuria tytonicola]|uniref:Ribonuclease n=1 Tax=Kocuria tytonicola TaxID=2055946 RepID=A0A3L9LEX9_9MICC|nr:ribonuclease HII [Kocuria tytonicola]RLY94742.1 ribonuclease HII [Kocuria tytonicola]